MVGVPRTPVTPDLRFAHLDGALLQDEELADLERANLDGADLERADFERAELRRSIRRFVTVIAALEAQSFKGITSRTR